MADEHTPIYYQDQTAWAPADFYALWRYLNRLFLNQGERKTDEIASLDLTRMSPETRYLAKHLLILQKRFTSYTELYPNLKALHRVGPLDHPLRLSEKPTFAHQYFTDMGIYL